MARLSYGIGLLLIVVLFACPPVVMQLRFGEPNHDALAAKREALPIKGR